MTGFELCLRIPFGISVNKNIAVYAATGFPRTNLYSQMCFTIAQKIGLV